jgi:hypothetical protein
MTTTTTQKNLYIMLDSCGRTITKANEYGTQSPEWIEASNVKDASKTARELFGSKVWKVQRCYNGGVRG